MEEIIEDVKIVEELQNNSQNGNKLLFDKYYGSLKKYLINNYDIGSDIAEDIVSNTLLSVYENIHQFTFTSGKNCFRNWVFQIAKNKLIDYKRSETKNINCLIFDENSDFNEISKGLDIRNCDVNKSIINEYLSSGILEDDRKIIIFETLKEFSPEEQCDLWAYFKGVSHIDSANYRKMSYKAYRKRISRLSIRFFNKIGSKLKTDGRIYNEKFKKSY
jgi:DNA-directed RNA polymerase specialized sigma24 family protein